MPVNQNGGLTGIILAATSAGLFATAWYMFDAGRPGAPPFSDTRPDYGFETGVAVYVPDSVGIKSVAVSADYKHNPVNERETLQGVTVRASGFGPRREEPFFAIIELEDGAQMDHIESTEPGLSIRNLANQQLLVVQLEDFREIRVSGVMRIPALNTENSRTNFVSPRVGAVNRCDFLTTVSPAATPRIPFERWNDAISPCDSSGDIDGSASVEIVDLYRTAPRLDYVVPEPIGEPDSLQWKSDDAGLGLRVRASYVDINREAIVQRLLFLSGVIIGLAAACAPYAVERILRGFFRRGKSTDTAGRNEPPETTGGHDGGGRRRMGLRSPLSGKGRSAVLRRSAAAPWPAPRSARRRLPGHRIPWWPR